MDADKFKRMCKWLLLCTSKIVIGVYIKLQYVSEVVIGAPYSVTKDVMDHFKVDIEFYCSRNKTSKL